MFDALFLCEKVWWGHDVSMLLDSFGGEEHDGALKKYTENVISKVILAILGSWRWGPYGGSDL
jgi:hypothetical protein